MIARRLCSIASAGKRRPNRSGWILEIHGHVVEQPGRQQAAEHAGLGAIGVELDLEAEAAHRDEALAQAALQGPLAAGHHHAAEPPAATAEQVEDLPRRHRRRRLGVQEIRIVAVTAAQIAALRENHRGQFTGEVDEAAGLQTADQHAQPSATA